MKTEKLAIGKIKPNKDNPRIIKDEHKVQDEFLSYIK